jgi:ActR/RegA family two-component response regulator
MHNALLEARQPTPIRPAEGTQPIVVIVSDDPALAMSLRVVCDFLSLGVERIASSEDVMAVLENQRPMAVVTEMDCRDQDGFNVMMTVSRYDPNLPVLVLTGDDPVLTGAAEAVEELWGLTCVAKSPRTPKVGKLVDFFFTAGRKTGCMRLMPV